MTLENKILGSLLGAAIGDTMGAPTELCSKALIKEYFGGEVRTIIAPPDDTFARGSKPGRVTDDFSLIHETVEAILENGGVIDQQSAEKAVLRWAEDEEFFNQYAGPTTRAAVSKLKGEEVYYYYDFICCDNAKASNGSAMKIAPAGIFNPKDVDKAIDAAMIISQPTHNNNLSISGACAVAAAVSEAFKEEANIYSIIQAGIYGAQQGLIRSHGKCAILAGPDIEKRIKFAVSIGINASSLDDATTQIADLIGSSIHISESVPAVFGILAACKNDPMEAIIAAVNIGSDTDTIASMLGGIVGALHGDSAFPEEYLTLIDEVNNYDLKKMAGNIHQILS